mmetsp:Transcript_20313/g.36857  ORF Transcript_20313/g.36857 Transcript_20313/m.36857 type:complete len:110 (+) Transcript_20313:367-696(+)
MTMGGFFNKHRAMATRCFSPPDSLSPRSPTIVSQPSGRDLINVVSCAASATSSSSSSVASRRPYRILFRSVSLNMVVFCGTTPMLPRSDFCWTMRTSSPLTFTAPPSTS